MLLRSAEVPPRSGDEEDTKAMKQASRAQYRVGRSSRILRSKANIKQSKPESAALHSRKPEETLPLGYFSTKQEQLYRLQIVNSGVAQSVSALDFDSNDVGSIPTAAAMLV